MKIIDKTPFLSADGQISLFDKAKAILKFGPDWIPEVGAQKVIISVLGRILDKNYTVLRNVTPPGVEASIPLILVGPTGVYVLYATHFRGMYRAKGDVWGTISGNTFKPASVNLLTLTARMGRAVQVCLQRQGYKDLPDIESILLCADPGLHADSLRPTIRVIMRDALERFVVSISQARVVLSEEAVLDILDRLQNPPPAPSQKPAQAPAPAAPSTVPEAAPESAEPYVPAFALPESKAGAFMPETQNAAPPASDFRQQAATLESEPESSLENLFAQSQQLAADPINRPSPLPATAQLEPQPHPAAAQRRSRRRRRKGFSCGQWAFLSIAILIEVAILVVFFLLNYKNFNF